MSLPQVALSQPESLSEQQVWELLGRADVILRGVLEARDAGDRRRWEERARAWLRDVSQAWVRTPARAGRRQ